MRALSLISLGVVVFAGSLASSVTAQEVKASDFLKAADTPPDASVTMTSTKNEALGEPVIQAKTKDGKADEVNAVRAANVQLKNGGKSGVKLIATGSGLGVVAYGTASYSRSGNNPNLIAIEQRLACLEADLQARRKLAEFLHGQSVAGKLAIATGTTVVDTPEESVANIDKNVKENYEESINKLIRGAVTFDMDDNPEAGKVTMSVVASPRTVGAVQSSGSAMMSVKDLETGFEFITNDINNNLLPPTGGKFIFVQPTGQFAWVSYGSAYWRINSNPEVEAALEGPAERTAEAAASAGMIGILNGEQVASEFKSAAEFDKKIKQYDEMTGTKVAEQTKAQCAAMTRESLSLSRVGSLPPGITTKEYTRGRWKLSVKVFVPEITAKARELAATMNENSPLKVKAKAVTNFQVNPDGSFKVGKDGKLIPESLGSGQVTNPNDL